jgi:hypothetical protein
MTTKLILNSIYFTSDPPGKGSSVGRAVLKQEHIDVMKEAITEWEEKQAEADDGLDLV